MNKLTFKGPLNNLSFGNVAYNFLRELYKKNIAVSLFPVGDTINLESFEAATNFPEKEDFKQWLKGSADTRLLTVDKEVPLLQLWHLNGSEQAPGSNNFLYTFYELDSPTPSELNLANFHSRTIFSSEHAASAFKRAGCATATAVPIGFDPDFFKTEKTLF